MLKGSERGSHADRCGSPSGGEVVLPRLKGAFSFRLATTSYILHAGVLPNLHFLGPYLDEVELVLFESGREENLPSPGEIQSMVRVARRLGIRFNVHLPTDVFLGDPDIGVRRKACDTILRFYHRTGPLEPTVYVLHLDRARKDAMTSVERRGWLDRLNASVDLLVAEGLEPGRVAIENLDYPLEWVMPLIEETGMRCCLDVGHLIRYGFNLRSYFEAYLGRTSMVHLHGVRNGVDHCSLDVISDRDWQVINQTLKAFRGGVSVEVFSIEDLISSLRRFEKLSRWRT